MKTECSGAEGRDTGDLCSCKDSDTQWLDYIAKQDVAGICSCDAGMGSGKTEKLPSFDLLFDVASQWADGWRRVCDYNYAKTMPRQCQYNARPFDGQFQSDA